MVTKCINNRHKAVERHLQLMLTLQGPVITSTPLHSEVHLLYRPQPIWGLTFEFDRHREHFIMMNLTLSRTGCLSAAAKRYKFIRKLCHFQQMDFEYALWQMIYLFISPQKVYRNFHYRKSKSPFYSVLKIQTNLFIGIFVYRFKSSVCQRWSSIFGIIGDVVML